MYEGITMNKRFAVALILSGSVFATVAFGAALQEPSEKGASRALPVNSKPRNLQVLPRNLSGNDIDKLMRQYQQYLGVPCGYCHEEDPESKTVDYASDQNPIKETARFMITMTSDINNKYLSRLGDRRYADPITCGNCHRGRVEPPVFETKPTP
jgi:Photosynthetic reaction centre cytochrome C subunit